MAVKKVQNLVKVNKVLISVSDKQGLEELVPRLIMLNQDVLIFSTGGTYKKIADILGGQNSRNLCAVSDYTNQPETQGGLVKTLDFKIYLGLLTETFNESHQADLERTKAVAIDMVICNLYPFAQVVADPEVNPEEARSNIDIGGPCMIRAASKNYLRVAPVVDPLYYPRILEELEKNGACTSLSFRWTLARAAFSHTAEYERKIEEYFLSLAPEKVNQPYEEIL